MQKRLSSSVRIFYPKFNQEEIIHTIHQRLRALAEHLPISKVLLFGSYVKGNYTVASDIDILVVYRGKARKEAYAMVKEILDIPYLEPHIYTEKEYKEIKGTVDKMTRNSIVLFQARD